MSQKLIVRHLGVDPRTQAKWEQGKRVPDREHSRRLNNVIEERISEWIYIPATSSGVKRFTWRINLGLYSSHAIHFYHQPRLRREQLLGLPRRRRILNVPLAFFPRLLHADQRQRERYELGGGTGIHWDEPDDDISVEGMLLSVGDRTRHHLEPSQKSA